MTSSFIIARLDVILRKYEYKTCNRLNMKFKITKKIVIETRATTYQAQLNCNLKGKDTPFKKCNIYLNGVTKIDRCYRARLCFFPRNIAKLGRSLSYSFQSEIGPVTSYGHPSLIVKICNSLALPMASLFGKAKRSRWYKICSILSALRLKRL